MSTVDDDEWIAYVEAGLSPSQLAFLAAWRTRIQAWPHDARADLRPTDEHDGCLVVYADLVNTARHNILLTIAAHVDDTTVRCDWAHNQHFLLPAKPTANSLATTGSPQELAERAADWFEANLRRPVVCHEWRLRGGQFARTWLFADTEEPLSMQGPKQSRHPDSICAIRTEWS